MTSKHPADGSAVSEWNADRERAQEKLRYDLIALDLEFDLVTARLEEAIDRFEKAEVDLHAEVSRLEKALGKAEAERDAALKQVAKPKRRFT